ncbi:vWA domain-containing protein [Paludisphaera soli]|uniref:vWA domain-containing protein n=1 Tax=Paludisphaera soli TaxID=2712865 RepID=UPI0013EB3D19|nr:vWA domain-containing protein [Paludisphaera soli]
MRTTHRILVALLGLGLLAASTRAEGQEDAKPRPSPPRTRPRDGEDAPKVRTPEEVEARKRSPFLQRPGESRYDAEDVRDLPPWSRASFFGVPARGLFFVYVIDQSGSMVDDDRLTRAAIELRRSVGQLQSPQRFEVVFYNDEATSMPGGPIPRPADPENKDKLATWLRTIEPDGGTSPRRAVVQALALRPDAVFLLSDGDFPDGVADDIARANARKIPVHCIDLAGGLAGDDLRKIARESGGRYASRPGRLHEAGAGR